MTGEDQGEDVIFELGCVLLAPDGAGGVPEHLLHGFRAENRALSGAAFSAPGLRILAGFVNAAEDELVATEFVEQFNDGVAGLALRLGFAVLPPIHGCKGDVEATG